MTCPSAQYQTGIRCPHHSCREMHQSRMFSIQRSYTPFQCGGMNVTVPSWDARNAGSASGFIFTNHCSESRGSTTVPQR